MVSQAIVPWSGRCKAYITGPPFAIPLRLPFAAHPKLLAPVLQIVHRVISGISDQASGTKAYRRSSARRA